MPLIKILYLAEWPLQTHCSEIELHLISTLLIQNPIITYI